jgi:hypothetical protein
MKKLLYILFLICAVAYPSAAQKVSVVNYNPSCAIDVRVDLWTASGYYASCGGVTLGGGYGNPTSTTLNLCQANNGYTWEIDNGLIEPFAPNINPVSGQTIYFDGCNNNYKLGGNDASDLGPLPSKRGCGMPVWSVTEPYISLWLHDEPLGYQPALGPRISFELAFKQRELVSGFNTNIFSIGKRWNCSWLSYVAQSFGYITNSNPNSTNNVVYFPGGGQRTYYTTNDYLTDTVLTGNATTGFTLTYPDGSRNIYNFIVTNNSGVFQEAFLTQHMDAQSNKTTLIYSSYSPYFPVIQLQTVVDGDGRTNSIFYSTTNVYSTNLISHVTDAFGRTALLSYNINGDLTGITDVMTNSTTLAYDTNDWVTNMTTPYGTTSFAITDSPFTNATATTLPPNGRSVLITHPDGTHDLYLYQDSAPGIASSYPTNQVPSTP